MVRSTDKTDRTEWMVKMTKLRWIRVEKHGTAHIVDVFPTMIGENWITRCGRVFHPNAISTLTGPPTKMNRCKTCVRCSDG